MTDPQEWTEYGFDVVDEPPVEPEDIPDDELGPADPVDDVADLSAEDDA